MYKKNKDAYNTLSSKTYIFNVLDHTVELDVYIVLPLTVPFIPDHR